MVADKLIYDKWDRFITCSINIENKPPGNNNMYMATPYGNAAKSPELETWECQGKNIE